jgi:hypothetical protein
MSEIFGKIGTKRTIRKTSKIRKVIMPIDVSLLEHVREVGGKIVARCPACAELGRDSHGKNHLAIFRNGSFACAAFPGDKEHRRRVWALAGDKRAKVPKVPMVAVCRSWVGGGK